MAARDGMAWLITEARKHANAGTADHTVAGTDYWTDDQIQTVFDQHRMIVKQAVLTPLEDFADNDTTYTQYPYWNVAKWAEGTASGWSLLDSNGSAAPSYTVEMQVGLITFAADTGGSAYYLSVNHYPLYTVVSEIWRQKASMYETLVDWSSDNHRISASQQRDHALAMATKYEKMNGGAISYGRFVRTDEGHPWENYS